MDLFFLSILAILNILILQLVLVSFMSQRAVSQISSKLQKAKGVWIQPKQQVDPYICPPLKCILHELGHDSSLFHHMDVCLTTTPNEVILTPHSETYQKNTEEERIMTRIGHSPVCPPFQLTKPQNQKHISNTSPRPIQLASAIVVMSSDQKVLLTQRSSKMRTFPNVWVVPGGGVDYDDPTLQHAAIRELMEETGIDLSKDLKADIQLLCMWESCYPIHIEIGFPKRQHLVVYFCAQLQLDSTEINAIIDLEEDGEVSRIAWLSIDALRTMNLHFIHQIMKKGHRDTIITSNSQNASKYERIECLSPNKNIDEGLVAGSINTSTIAMNLAQGTEFAIAEWFRKLDSIQNKTSNLRSI